MKLQSIQILRGLAALVVVLYHIRSLEVLGISSNGTSETPLVGGLFTNGYAGVDLFFVISGFIMVYVTRDAKRGPESATQFLFARVTRIYPVWWLFVGLTTLYLIVIHVLLPGGLGWQAISPKEPILPFIAKSFALIPQEKYPVLSVGWTLIHEVYFYLVFTILLLLPRKWLSGLLFVWGCAVVSGSLIGLSGPIAVDAFALVFHPMTMEFILGAAIGVAVTSGYAWRPGIVTLLASLWLMAAMCYQGLETAETLQWGRILWFGMPCAALVYGFASLEITKRMAWLVPAAIGILFCGILYQLYGLDDKSPSDVRLGATILSVIVGGGMMLIVLWIGWLGGQAMPDRIRALAPSLARLQSRLVTLGDWSFSLYLSHILVLSLLRRAFDQLGDISLLAPVFQLGHQGWLDNVAFLIAGLALSITASALAYKYFEKPCIIVFGQLRETLFHRKHMQVEVT